MTLEFIPHTKRRKMTKPRAAKIFLARNGICVTCRQQIRAGQKWFIEHPEAVAQGGSDDDADLWPAHTACKAVKDAADARAKAKRDRLVTAGWQRETPKASRWQSRGFAPPRPRKNATSPVIHKSQRHEDTQ
jgi:5-methylcytosine-specific restriction protein A